MEQLVTDIEVPSMEDDLYEELTLQKGYVWNIYPQSQRYELRAYQAENLGNIMPQRGKALFFNLVNAPEDITIRLQSSAPKGMTAKSFYSRRFFFDIGGIVMVGNGGGSGETLTFNAPLNKDNGLVSLLIENDLKVSDDNNALTLDLLQNDDFKTLKQDVNALKGLTLQFVGMIDKTKDEVTENKQLLSDFVKEKLTREPKNGDLVRTNDAYIFIYDGSGWIDFGESVIQIATTSQVGVMMFGTQDGELQDAGQGKAKVIGWEKLSNKMRVIPAGTDPLSVLQEGQIGFLELS